MDWSLGSNEQALATWAAHIPNIKGENGILTSIQFWLKSNNVPKSAMGAPFKVRILNFNDATNLPGEHLLQKELLVYPNDKKVVIDVSEERLRLPINGLVVAIDFFFAGEQYVHAHQVKQFRTDGSSIDTLMKSYGASIEAVRADNLVGNGFIYSYKRNEWSEVENSTREKLAPRIELGIKLCE